MKEATNWAEALTSMLSDTASTDEAATRRRQSLINSGVLPNDAAIIDAAFLSMVTNLTKVVGETFDELEVYLWPVALSFMMRGAVVNMELIEEQVREGLLEIAKAMGATVVSVNSAEPMCMCPSCVAVREANAANLNNRTIN